MKEKETYYFSSDWEDALSTFVRDKAGVNLVGHLASTKEWVVIYPDGCQRLEPMPQYALEWIAANPAPKINRDQFIHQLGERVAALEAALAEKGGEL